MPVKVISGMHLEFAADEGTFDIEHELAHLHGISHHHAADNVIHFDDSDESLRHNWDHYGSSQPSMLSSIEQVHVVLLVLAMEPVDVFVYVPYPFLEQLLPPPRSLS